MKKRLFLFFTNLCLALISIVFTYRISLFVAETYFFDKIIYKKSKLHGYYQSNNPKKLFFDESNTLLDLPRFNDLKKLYTPNQHSANILGTSDQENRKTIAIIGDSNTFGLGVRRRQRFSYLLEKELSQLASDKEVNFEILNLSLVGDDLLDHYLKYKKLTNKANVDLYIFAIVTNDLKIEKNDKYPNKNLVYEKLVNECGQLSSFVSTKKNISNEEYFEISRKQSTHCAINYILEEIDYEKSIFFSTEGEGIKYQKYRRPINQNSYYTFALANFYQLIKKSDHTILNPWEGQSVLPYHGLQISTKESHPNSHLHKCFAYFLTQEIIKLPSISPYFSQRQKQKLLCEYEQKIAKEVSTVLNKKVEVKRYCHSVK
jgi:hypothetical protein